ncbi:MAG: hypothetical protein B6D36_14490 [Planctomycetes bacterium UTPLA1]|nr:MAG: hypothetical protein B6D36_14490 [Planctomycetes bacterium UTPLA1]
MTTKRNNSANLILTVALATVIVFARPSAAQPVLQAADRQTAITRLMQPITARVLNAAHVHADADGAACLELPEMSVMFDADATATDVQTFLKSLPDDDVMAAFQPQGSRWTYTATNGTVAEGMPLTITYSFMPDGTQINTSYGNGPSDLFARMNGSFPGGMTAFKAEFAQAMNRWSELTNITYVEVADDGQVWGALGQLNARGDVRIGMIPLGTPLAVNHYPQFGGDMVFDSNDMATFANSVNDFRSLRNTIMHEHGHGLGLKHNMPTDNTKLMEPYLNTNFDGPQDDDIRGAQFIYGDWAEYNDEPANNEFINGTLRSVATHGVITHVLEDLALERDNASDWYGFGADPGTPIAIRVEPIGSTYTQAPQDNPNNTSTVNSKAARNLALKLYTRTSVSSDHLTLLAQINFNDAGEAEYHPPIPYGAFGFGYMLANIYSNDGIDDVQRYRLTISNSAIEAQPEPQPQTAPVFGLFNVTAGQNVFDGTTVQFGNVNLGQSASRTLAITNSGDANLTIGQITLAGPGAADYGFTLLQSTIAPGSTGNLAVSFLPSAAGVRQAVMTIPNNDPDQANFSFILSGSGVQPAAPVMEVRVNNVVVPHNNTVDLGDVEIGDSATASLIVKNVGNATLNVSNINFGGAAAGEYSTALASANLSPGAQVTASVTVAPLAAGNRDAELRLFNNSSQSLFVVRFTTNGVQPQQPITDCNSNGIDDAQDLADGTSEDCNTNGVPDECEVDSDNDGVIDDCDVCAGEDDNLDTDGDGTPNCLDQDPVDPDVGGNPLPPDEDNNDNRNGFCGAGSAMPMMAGMLGLCGAGLGRRRRK